MTARIDHIVLATNSLESAKAQWLSASGIQAIDGGSHKGLGTRNALSGLSDGAYIELLAPDPEQPIKQRPSLPSTLSPFHWAIAVDDLGNLASKLDAKGASHTGVIDMARATPSGSSLCWQLLFVRDDCAGGVMPFFINWLDSQHPSKTLDAGAELIEICATAPAQSALFWLLPTLGLSGPRLRKGSASLEFKIAGANGIHTLRSDAPTGIRVR